MLSRFWIASLFICFGLSLNAQVKSKKLINNENLVLEFLYDSQADISKKDWIKLKLTNKLEQQLNFKEISYSINAFDIDEEGQKVLKIGQYGRARKYDLLHYYHDIKIPKKEQKVFYLNPKEEVEFWKYQTNTAGTILDYTVDQKSEICALMEVIIEVGTTLDSYDEIRGEVVFCFNWTPSKEIEIEKIRSHFLEKLGDVTQRHINSSIINTMALHEKVISGLPIDKLVKGIKERAYTDNSSERLAVLKALNHSKGFGNKDLIDHYSQCMNDKNCNWQKDLLYFWDNQFFHSLISCDAQPNDKLEILECHYRDWSNDESFQTIVKDYVTSNTDFNYESVPTEDNFTQWYQNVRQLSTSRHPQVIRYLVGLLDNETFLPLYIDGNSKLNTSRTNSRDQKPTYFRICDVAYVCLLRALNEIKINKTFDGFLFKQNIYIDEKMAWKKYGCLRRIQNEKRIYIAEIGFI